MSVDLCTEAHNLLKNYEKIKQTVYMSSCLLFDLLSSFVYTATTRNGLKN